MPWTHIRTSRTHITDLRMATRTSRALSHFRAASHCASAVFFASLLNPSHQFKFNHLCHFSRAALCCRVVFSADLCGRRWRKTSSEFSTKNSLYVLTGGIHYCVIPLERAPLIPETHHRDIPQILHSKLLRTNIRFLSRTGCSRGRFLCVDAIKVSRGCADTVCHSHHIYRLRKTGFFGS